MSEAKITVEVDTTQATEALRKLRDEHRMVADPWHLTATGLVQAACVAAAVYSVAGLGWAAVAFTTGALLVSLIGRVCAALGLLRIALVLR